VRSGGPGFEGLVRGQLELRARLADYLGAWNRERSGSLLALVLGVSFLYGSLHALGPGHRKTVVFAIYIARRAPWWEPAATSLALAGLHGGTAIVLLLAFRGAAGALSVATDSIATYMEGCAYCLLIAVAVFLLVRAIADLARGVSREDSPMSLGALILTGVYPCPGAILILALSLSLDITGIGMLAVAAMSLGMAIPIAAFSYLGWLGRSGLLRSLKENERALAKAGGVIEVAGFAVLLAFAIYIALPFVSALAA
jgi:ABC-type nickel/cobalt efflux system permease component RcnA